MSRMMSILKPRRFFMSIEINGIGHQAALQQKRDTVINGSMRAASDVIVQKEAAEQAERWWTQMKSQKRLHKSKSYATCVIENYNLE